MKFFVCEVCGNIVDSVRDSGRLLTCCGKHMKEMSSNPIQDALGRHAPICHIIGNTVYVAVSSMEHPMEEDHYIQWIAIETENGRQIRSLTPSDAPFARFQIADDDNLTSVYAFCSKHGLWRYDVVSSQRGDSVWKCYSA